MKKIKINIIVKFVVTLFLLCTLLGIVFYFNSKPDLGLYIDSFMKRLSNTHQNVFILNIGVICLIFVSSLIVVGLPLSYLYLCYEGFTIGFTLCAFVSQNKINGLLFYILFLLLSKLIQIIINMFFIVTSTKYAVNIIPSLLNKNKEKIYRSLVYQFYRFAMILLLTILNSTFIYFFVNKILVHFV